MTRYSFVDELTTRASKLEAATSGICKTFYRIDFTDEQWQPANFEACFIHTYVDRLLATLTRKSEKTHRAAKEAIDHYRDHYSVGLSYRGVFITAKGTRMSLDTPSVVLNWRAFIGAYRLKMATGFDIAAHPGAWGACARRLDADAVTDYGRCVYEAVTRLQAEQRNITSQLSYVKEREGEFHTARAFEQKKHIDRDHYEMARYAEIAPWFPTIEIDNDVKAKDWEDFEAQVKEAMAILPWKAEAAPTLRVRKLGRHKAAGIYFPHVNTVCVDVRTSGSFIHEYAHHLDFAVYGSASTSEAFRAILDGYARNIAFPEGMSLKKRTYYRTPTEVFARAAEVYYMTKLGANTRLIEVDNKAGRFDYAPLEAMREEVCAYFDDLFSPIDTPAPVKAAPRPARVEHVELAAATQDALF